MSLNEDTLVQQTSADYLRDALGWESVFAYNQEDYGDGSFWVAKISARQFSFETCERPFSGSTLTFRMLLIETRSGSSPKLAQASPSLRQTKRSTT